LPPNTLTFLQKLAAEAHLAEGQYLLEEQTLNKAMIIAIILVIHHSTQFYEGMFIAFDSYSEITGFKTRQVFRAFVQPLHASLLHV
jgi:hypothetical protein